MVKRQRIHGRRRDAVLDAAVTVLIDVGYDRLTYDAVARKAKASKATLYRHWPRKSTLAIDALLRSRSHTNLVATDTGELRSDLIAHVAAFITTGRGRLGVLSAIVSALGRDDALAYEFRSRALPIAEGELQAIFERARARGETSALPDMSLMTSTLPAMLIHRTLLLGLPPDLAFVTRVVDGLILPSAMATPDTCSMSRPISSTGSEQ